MAASIAPPERRVLEAATARADDADDARDRPLAGEKGNQKLTRPTRGDYDRARQGFMLNGQGLRRRISGSLPLLRGVSRGGSRLGSARGGSARRGSSRRGSAGGSARRGSSRRGSSRRGSARGSTRRGSSRRGSGSARRGSCARIRGSARGSSRGKIMGRRGAGRLPLSGRSGLFWLSGRSRRSGRSGC